MSNFGTKRNDIKWARFDLAEDSLIGKRIAVIGGTNGLGRAIALEFISKGAEVIVVGRTFRDQGIPRLIFIKADLSELKNAQSLAKELPVETFDILIMTQGIFAGKQRKTNSAGIELDMATSYLSRFIILREMADRIGKNRINSTTKPRIFVWGFPGGKRKATLDDFNSEKNYRWTLAHSNTVIGNESLVIDSAERFPSVNFYGMNPGIINSNIMSGVLGDKSVLLKIQQTIMGILFQSEKKYAKIITPLLVSPDIEQYSGIMFGRHGDPIFSNPVLLDKSYTRQVIEESEKLIKSV
jgi:NAD(P)-dependent dehydrogenase (short-subunit alcohol dehydrogenase family)